MVFSEVVGGNYRYSTHPALRRVLASNHPCVRAPSVECCFPRCLSIRRTLHAHREHGLKRMMSMGTRRRAHTLAAADGGGGAAVAMMDSVSPALDSGATSPDAVLADARITRSNTEATASEAAAGLGPSPHPADKCQSCNESRPNSNGRRSCSYKFRRGGGKAKGGDGGGNRPPEMHIKQHGRGGGKDKAWRAMHLVQSLKYHEVRGCGVLLL